MDLLIGLLVILAAIGAVVLVSKRNQKTKAVSELEPSKKLVFEDVTALGEQLQQLDLELTGTALDEGMRADYQRALDAYEAAKTAGDAMAQPDDVTHVTEIVEDGRYAIACVRARVAGEPLPARRPACFFDPRHGLSVTDVDFAPVGGQARKVPACALDAERVAAGAAPDVRQVMVGARRMPYWAGGRAYQPYARGYFGNFGALDWLFIGLFADDILWGLGGLAEGLGEGVGGMFEGIGDGIGNIFDGFDF
ncbi:hypothetical protein BH09ACT11_BH09ACT11_20470 [soil metagenome]